MLAGRHEARTGLGGEFGAMDVVAERGKEGVARVRELAGGVVEDHHVLVALAVGIHRHGRRLRPAALPRQLLRQPVQLTQEAGPHQHGENTSSRIRHLPPVLHCYRCHMSSYG
ncbi:hypothetical protein GCM10010394_48220 [Streptomyces crystallinus]|uniref:Uncharacterized protein n=1 Tax=Streptomyces crystallinus TaxID=68191 RepID=A0ABP3RRA5_9ACTN